MTGPVRLGTAAALAALAALAFAVALRPGPLSLLAPAGAALLASALRRARSAPVAGLASALAGLGLTSVAAIPLAPLAPLGYAAAALALAVPFALPGLVHHALRRRAPGRGDAGLVVGWLALETLFGLHALFGTWTVPVLGLGYALVDTPFLPAAGLTGVRGLSLLVLASGAALSRLRRRPLAAVLATAATAALGLLAPLSWTVPAQRGEPDLLPLRIVQPALDRREMAAAHLDPASGRAHLAALADASRAPGRLVVWPEGALPAPLELPLRDGRPDALPSGASVLFGSGTRRDGGTFNSALLWHDDRLELVADKRRLVPFTESSLATGAPRPPTAWDGQRLAALVCWEAAFPDLARRAAGDGATLLVVLANDAYAPHGPVAVLHLRAARLRAAEVGLPLAFASQRGPSAAIDAAGRVVARLAPGRGVLDADLPAAAAATPFRRLGDALGNGSLLATLVGLLSRLVATVSRARPGAARAPRGGEA